ncbi:MAG TPA: MaoC family dehydratase [Vicinamibacterales bacterium]
MPVVFDSPRDLLGREGESLGVTEWLAVDQKRIDAFADVSGDRQWIHVDPVRARHGPFGKTIAHGYLTLSLVNLFLPQLIEVRNFSSGVNVGVDGLRFLAPVPVDSRIRGRGELVSAREQEDGAIRAIVRVTVDIEGVDKPACVVDTISLYS